MRLWLLVLTGAVALGPVAAAVGDPERGRQVFESLKCSSCHSAGGIGGKSAPNLGMQKTRGRSPSELAAAMWNHAPAMWAQMEKAAVAKGPLSTQDAADLFAWFQSARYFEKAGDAAAGKALFASKGCAACHSANAKPPAQWESVTDAIELARQMWNHAPAMRAAAKGAKAPELTAEELNNIAAYASASSQRKQAMNFAPASEETGKTLLEAKGCTSCHKGSQALPGKTQYTASAEVAAAMWNHAARMKDANPLRPEEMRRIVGYLWSRQFENEGGDAKRGEALFAKKQCAGCHGSSAPYLAHGEESSSYGMVSVLWQHGPEMQRQMKGKGVTWPQLAASDLADIIAYMKSAK